MINRLTALLWTEEEYKAVHLSDLCTGAAVRPLWSPVSSRSGTSHPCSHTRSAARTREHSHIHQCLRGKQTAWVNRDGAQTYKLDIYSFHICLTTRFSLTCISLLDHFFFCLVASLLCQSSFLHQKRHHLIFMTFTCSESESFLIFWGLWLSHSPPSK